MQLLKGDNKTVIFELLNFIFGIIRKIFGLDSSEENATPEE